MSTTTGIGVEEFLAGDWPDGAQLVDGELVVNDPTLWHQHLAVNAHDALRRWTRDAPGRGYAGLGGNWVLAAGLVYKPDVWWVSEEDRFDPASATFDVALEVGLDEDLASTLLPGFLLPVRELFTEP